MKIAETIKGLIEVLEDLIKLRLSGLSFPSLDHGRFSQRKEKRKGKKKM